MVGTASVVDTRVADQTAKRRLLMSPQTRGDDVQGGLTHVASELPSILALALVKAGSGVSIHTSHAARWTSRGDTHVVEPRATLSACIAWCATDRALVVHDRCRDTPDFPTESARPMRRESARPTAPESRA